MKPFIQKRSWRKLGDGGGGCTFFSSPLGHATITYLIFLSLYILISELISLLFSFPNRMYYSPAIMHISHFMLVPVISGNQKCTALSFLLPIQQYLSLWTFINLSNKQKKNVQSYILIYLSFTHRYTLNVNLF